MYCVLPNFKTWLRTCLKVECSLRRWAGEMLDGTGKSFLLVGFRHPEMMRSLSFSAGVANLSSAGID